MHRLSKDQTEKINKSLEGKIKYHGLVSRAQLDQINKALGKADKIQKRQFEPDKTREILKRLDRHTFPKKG